MKECIVPECKNTVEVIEKIDDSDIEIHKCKNPKHKSKYIIKFANTETRRAYTIVKKQELKDRFKDIDLM